MAPRKKSVRKTGKQRRSMIRAILRIVVSFTAVMRKGLKRVPAMTAGTAAKVFGSAGKAVKSVSRRFSSMPRSLRVVSVYLLVLLFTGAIFAWRMAGLRLNQPDPTQWSFEFTEVPAEWDSYLQGRSAAGENFRDMDVDAGLTAARDKSEADASEESPAGPVFQPGIWPVAGKLLYDYDTVIVIRDNPKATIFTLSKGIAVLAPAGTEVVVAWDGTVIKVSEADLPYGQSVTIEHEFNLTSYYGALGSVRVREGDQVKQGDPIGTVGPGDDQEPSHLFLKMMQFGDLVDPKEMLKPR